MNLLKCVSKFPLLFIYIGVAPFAYGQTASDYAATPPFVTDSSDPAVVINLSVELTQQAEAFTGATQTYAGGTFCPGRLNISGTNHSVCYTSAEQYIGYFDPEKCYVYEVKGGGNTIPANYDTDNIRQEPDTDLTTTVNRTTDYFKPVGAATNRSCSGNQFSGNFMNWATMTALDEFRAAMVGGARLVDTIGASPQTLLTRTHRYGDWPFVQKRIESSGLTVGNGANARTFSTTPSSVTPFNVSELVIINNNGNNGNRVTFRDGSGSTLAELSVIVEVCNQAAGLESNCVAYGDDNNSWYKPEGVMQRNANNMRFALLTYTGQDGVRRNGGVLRSNAKYIGYLAPQAAGGLAINTYAETNEFGQYIKDPNCIVSEHTAGCSLAATAFSPTDGVSNSGIINYINSFGLSGGRYKGNDPIGELFYEGFRYLATEGNDRAPVPEYYLADGATLNAIAGANQKDNFPIIEDWEDPVLHQCQLNYMINIGDQFAHADNSLPGVDPSIVAGGVPLSSAGTYQNILNWADPDGVVSAGGVDGLTDKVGTLENFDSNLGERTRGRTNNGWLVAGLAYYGNTEDVRDDFEGVQRIKSFFVDTQEFNSNPPQRENNPLWLAAKYGGFDDDNGDRDPGNGVQAGVTDEWDENGDGVPDTYTLSSQPANLVAGLNAAFSDITGNLRAGSAAAVSTNSRGEGIIVQGVYKPSDTSSDGRRIEWVGILQSFFIDENDNFREDTDGDDQLTNADTVIQFRTETSATGDIRGVFDRYTTTDGGETISPTGELGIDIEDLNTVWNARNELGELSASDVITQRSYGALASTGRYIFTAIDGSGGISDGDLTREDTIPFTAAQFPDSTTNNNFRYLGLDSVRSSEAPDIVNYIRGEENSNYRSRTTDYDNDGVDEVWRLGDIVSSSPLLVSSPNSRYDIIHGDATYAGFRTQYSDRRQVVYTGANDGMLHAFNAGFYDAPNQRFQTQLDNEVAHPLGSELWAYVPGNVLPHLQWLTQIDYPHSFYVDGIPQAYDVNIFTPSEKHPDGWGTILVVGLAFGGGDYTFDPDSDGTADGNPDDDITTRSSYIILDITDPESAPELVAEVSDPNLGYTTSRPTLIKNRRPNESTGSFSDPATNEWFLVFGSGPYGSDEVARREALDFAISDQEGKIFIYNLGAKAFVQRPNPDPDPAAPSSISYTEVETTDGAGFIGDLSSIDWNNDYIDDAVYFGVVRGSVGAAEGDLMRMPIEFTSTSVNQPNFSRVLSNNGTDSIARPFTGPPLLSRDSSGDTWVYAGSGRFFISDDSLSVGQQGYYGVRELVDGDGNFISTDAVPLNGTSSSGDLVNTTLVAVFDDSSVEALDPDSRTPTGSAATLENGDVVSNFAQLRNSISNARGWYFEFEEINARNVGRSGQQDVSVLFTEYLPSDNVCVPFGETLLNAVNFATGTSTPLAGLSSLEANNSSGSPERSRNKEFTSGLQRDVIGDDTIIGTGGDGTNVSESVIPQSTSEGRLSWREILIE